MNDPNMDTALEWANQLGSPRELPLSLFSVGQRVKLVTLVTLVNNHLVKGDLLQSLSREEKEKRLNMIAELSREFLPDISDALTRVNFSLRLWSGCLMAAKTIATRTRIGSNTPDSRARVFSLKIDRIAEKDLVYRAGTEAAPAFKRLQRDMKSTDAEKKSEEYSFDGVPRNSSVRRYG